MLKFIFVGIFLAGCSTSQVVMAPPVLEKPSITKAPASVPNVVGQPLTKIEHIVIIVQENHSFDNYFGTYCQAPVGSNPTCTTGAKCCERGPETEPGRNLNPVLLNDAENGAHNPPHDYNCEAEEMNNGRMDRFTTPTCGHPRNFAYADEKTVSIYRQWARQYAMADRFFQSVSGASSSNDMYLARAGFVFKDNEAAPKSYGGTCEGKPASALVEFQGPTIGNLLKDAKVSWSFYAEGYDAMVQAQRQGKCPVRTTECPAKANIWPCSYDPTDNPFSYYEDFRDNPIYMKDYQKLGLDLQKQTLPAVSFIKAAGYRSEHPGNGIKISEGMRFVNDTVQKILKSKYGKNTLIIFTMDEGGGYFDHVAPPPISAIDGKLYGPRIPTIAIGPFARKNYVSHVQMEHASLIKFIQWNWLGGKTGQLGMRDTVVTNIGSLLDAKMTGVPVPEN